MEESLQLRNVVAKSGTLIDKKVDEAEYADSEATGVAGKAQPSIDVPARNRGAFTLAQRYEKEADMFRLCILNCC